MSKGDDGQYVIEKSSHRAHSSSNGEMIHQENGRKKENSAESVVIFLAKEEDKLHARKP